ncbi:origin recognition complex subunit 4 [Dendroctonus ponderosae]|uniref:Origin recognition complex subunit 4 n=1 Tax=Dendroctonus ponderosae TaxID=77166 RepID=U4UPU4_DENPD|nr:origin recognition complex subunit 4 [Dendroctonus ponderosae]XP_019767250.2 origin recognition complex subunit 4 [Dendroctonus ponderosae]ERL92166.1 hypothetical protein D910_09486 [Dendroctonus ponderosae]KAH1006221.1 hypothetical protein HUJ05_006970 [Dendroctonus ponderosae]
MSGDFEAIVKYLKEKVLYSDEVVGKEKEKKQVLNLLRRTVVDGESNSMLLIGPQGAESSKLVNSVLKELEGLKDYIIVELHGLLHTDDRLALKSITFQLNLDNAVDGKVFGSFAENLAFLLACLRTGGKESSKSVIFILQAFDLFCAHHNQTLLYNLFDISQSAQTPICVLGLTCRINVIQLLEKRVKSRFSHRQMFLYAGSEETSDLDFALDRMAWYLELPPKCPVGITSKARDAWNLNVQELLKNKKFRAVTERMIGLELSEQILKNVLLKCLYSLTNTDQLLTVNQFEKELESLEKDEMVQVLQDLSALEICLIVAMQHHSDIYDNSPMNFEMVYTRYVKFAHKHSSMQNVQRPVVMKAFEHIEAIELIAMVNQQGSAKLQKEYQFFKLLVTPQQISEAIGKMQGLPTEIVQWWNSSLI